ncbi:hypothetical protein [Aliarcobacter skirrowii]|uniref:hypothetical protein n=1 Tax=Aliarcobacter skirrowii TaxID=28200 RepID=UPI0008256736|nr:hypothetical protein [Aliarcobacter skirrowii]
MYQCNFCEKNVEKLAKSHIIPKFFYDWVIKTSTLKRLRGTTSNKPVQDGYKIEFLCNDCEVIFSKYEKYFAEIFFSVLKDEKDISELKKLDFNQINKFLTSLFWRVLKNGLNNPNLNGNYTSDELSKFNIDANSLKNSFLNDSSTEFDTYLIPLTEYFEHNNVLEIKDYSYYERSIGMDFMIFDNHDGQASIIVKLPFILLVCELMSSDTDNWQGFKINNHCIELFEPYHIPQYIQDYMQYNYKQTCNIINSLPNNQMEKLIKQVKVKVKSTDGTIKTILKNKR